MSDSERNNYDGRGSRSHSKSRSHSHRRTSHSRFYTPDYRRRRSRSHSPMCNRRRHNGSRANPDQNSCVSVFGLSLYTMERYIREVFSCYGFLSGVNRICFFLFCLHRGFKKGRMDHANSMELDGRRKWVECSITKRAYTPTPGRISYHRETIWPRNGTEQGISLYSAISSPFDYSESRQIAKFWRAASKYSACSKAVKSP
uniref:Uncharacterized protein n=1 Tax=Leptobrachium leishanense TaxID=445787 RepID=A0A8C5PA56_9ANUR